MDIVVVYVDYFAAPSDDMATAIVDTGHYPGGPLDVVRTDVGPEMLVALEELLTGVRYQDNTPDTVDGRILASHHDDDVLILTVAAEAQTALATASDRRLGEIAVRWSQVEELTGEHNDSDALLPVLVDLRALACRARERGERLYCWMCA
jgi:hypothetical protein